MIHYYIQVLKFILPLCLVTCETELIEVPKSERTGQVLKAEVTVKEVWMNVTSVFESK